MAEVTIDPYIVQFAPDDKENPKNWSRRRRWYLTYLAALLAFNATFALSAPSGIATQLMVGFKLSEELAALTISLFVAGYCVGPLLWGPLSEQYGRRPIFLVTFPIYVCFQVGCALSKNAASIIIFRLLSGLFAAAPLTNSVAIISDIWDAKTRGKALILFALAPFVGPALSTSHVAQSGTSWPWMFWVLAIFAVVCIVFIYFSLPETYAPIILLQKAKQLRLKTGDERYRAPLELIQKKQLRKRLEETLARPFKILVCEPMLIAVTIYMSFVYGCIYLLFEAYPVVFTEGHHFQPGKSVATFRHGCVDFPPLGSFGLAFLPLVAGSVLGVIGYLLIFNPRYEAAMDRRKAGLVSPEIRLNLAISGAPLFAITFFWFGWTSYPSISYWAPMMAGVFMGLSSIWIFLSLFNYIIDVYLFAAASALAANTVIRSAAGAGFPLFATQMYTALDPRWASTVLGCVACLMIPIPIVLKRYGPTLRAKSRFAPSLT
ncbi:MFS general substrate transporter [Rhizopogon vinicolor AM-OR11-026]|uniref:MFS general substrate transporter n=1 Tax=Rhizopogon vinicolor AM-OR11-026 TaxID=1314800 RepID=A0A1B7N5Z6_9AGAM|nr:MFS general substrate transporter [Rhizopogon vinicolor AM-OR11-026]